MHRTAGCTAARARRRPPSRGCGSGAARLADADAVLHGVQVGCLADDSATSPCRLGCWPGSARSRSVPAGWWPRAGTRCQSLDPVQPAPVSVAGLGDSAPGAGAGLNRSALGQLSWAVHAAGMVPLRRHSAAAFLRARRAPYRARADRDAAAVRLPARAPRRVHGAGPARAARPGRQCWFVIRGAAAGRR